MARQAAISAERTKARDEQTTGFSFADLPEGIVEVPDVTGGMFLDLPRNQIPKSAFKELKNARTRDNWVGRRPGTKEIITKPDSNPVLKVATFEGEKHDWVVRVTDSNIHATHDSSQWFTMAGTKTWPHHPQFDRTQFLGWLFLSEPSSQIIRVSFEKKEYTELEEAPRARFITTFAERIVAANGGLLSQNRSPTRIMWSVNGDPTDWTGVGSGVENLIQNPSDFGDAITGIFGFGNQAVLLRERSIWHITRQPVSVAPFRFTAIVTGQGCDLPHTAARTNRGSLIFADRDTAGVWEYRPGSEPRRLSRPIDSRLASDLASATRAEATYDLFNQEYHLALSTGSGNWFDKFWVYSLAKDAWSFDDGPEASTLAVGKKASDIVLIDDLTGDIDSQSPSPDGFIDDWGDTTVKRPVLLKGAPTGEVVEYDFAETTDFDGTAFELLIQSQDFGSISRERVIRDILAALIGENGGDVTFEHSKDSENWRNSLTKSLDATIVEQRKGMPRAQLRGNELYWRLKSTAAKVRLLEYFIDISERGEQRQD